MRLTLLVLVVFFVTTTAYAQTSAFTYQGKLNDAGAAANGSYEMRFRLFDAGTGGEPQPQAAPITLEFTVAGGNPVPVSNGIFTVRLDFTAAAFPGAARFLEISVRRIAADPWTLLDPRQPVTRAPQSLSADNLSTECNLCVTNAQIQSIDAGKVTGVVAIANGGTGSSTQNFVDLSTDQAAIAGNKTFTGALSLSSGSAATPSMTFSGDPDTGFFRSAPDTLNFATGGASRMVIDPNGRVGVGGGFLFTQTRFTVIEDNPLETNGFGIVAQASGTTGFRRGVSGISNFTSPQPGTSGTGVYGQAGNAATQNIGLHGIAFGSGAANIGVFGTAFGGASNWAGYFDGNTYVSNPGVARSYINSDSNAGVALTLNNQPGWSVATANTGHFQIYNDAIGQNAFWIDKTSNDVGIGTIAPGAKLDVAGNINTSTQYNLGGIRVLAAPAGQNLFAGLNAGRDNTGGANSFVGHGAGFRNTDGRSNSFFGQLSGAANVSGIENAYFGAGSGNQSLASFNSFFGTFAGSDNTIGSGNAFFGRVSGGDNTEGFDNAFFGTSSGQFNTTGDLNTFIGSNAGQSNTVGNFNTTVGSVADVTANNLEFASAIGAFARVGTNDTIVIGKTAGTYNDVPRPADTVQIPGNLNLLGTLSANGSNLTNLNASNITSGTLAIANGGTGSSVKNFVDLSTTQTISGDKTFNNATRFSGATTVGGSNNTLTVEGSLNVGFNVTADQFFGDGANLTNLNVALNTTIVSATVAVPISSFGNATASCSSGSRVVGGGFSIPDAYVDVSDLVQSRPADDGSGWIVRMRNTGNSLSLPVTVWAICARIN